MFKVGLTGGIGCGKTTVSKLFEGHGVPIIDADVIAHKIVKPGQPALQKLVEKFGDSILQADGQLNRGKLRERVFANATEKIKLENILHPLIFAVMQKKINNIKTPYCLVSIPLLFETGMRHFVDRILVVDCPEAIQVQRVQQRDNLTDERIKSIMASQVTRAFRLENTDDIIDNTVNNQELAEQVNKLHDFYYSTGAALG